MVRARAGAVDALVATPAVLLATVASIAVKAALTLGVSERPIAAKVVGWSASLVSGASWATPS